MAARTIVAIRRQLERELRHRAWLEQHLKGSVALAQCDQRIDALRQLCEEWNRAHSRTAQRKRGRLAPTPIL
jgi:hypothetical protein